jgi:crotonobetainyl-CoA:carnitine CoA-transferase CaiB-like acyl-CoA transferase
MHLQPDRQWEPLMTVMGLTHLLDDPRFSDMDTRMENGTALVAEMDKAMATKTYDEWDELFRSSGDFIYAKVQQITELQDDPQVIANEYITEFDHPSIGPMKMCNHPNHYSKTPAKIWREAPQLGQHTEEVLIDELGYTWDDIRDLQNKKVIL